METTILISIDAFPDIYISKDVTPFLANFAWNEFRSHLNPLFAFRGVQTTLFTGRWPDEHGIWTEWCFRQKKSSLREKVSKGIKQIIDLLPGDRNKTVSRYVFDTIFSYPSRVEPNLIPINLLNNFELSQSKSIFKPNSLESIPTLFDMIRKEKLAFINIIPRPVTFDKGVVNIIKKLVRKKAQFHFWFIKLGLLDRLGHKYGPNIKILREGLKITDKRIEIIIKAIEENNHTKTIILSDHGMSWVHKKVDVLNELRKLKSKMGKDYIVFLDSTMARFWFFSEQAKEEIETLFDNRCFGHFLSCKEKRNLRIPKDTRYGDSVFPIDEGYVIHPDYFRRSTVPKGMHGYAYPTSREALPPLLISRELLRGKSEFHNLNYIDIVPIILDSLEIDPSEHLH